ncbi:glutaredoxin domain-containing protein [Eremococcus coleocola]|uniref:glutaredoxin domain-containing protein n=1 Tax=Eremococcus coleocola TaxID=88132 RepID=UPI0004023638|nr:glutaredoxin domain-containing protein [Eremococcus coleocola]
MLENTTEKQIIVYTKPNCMQCVFTKQYLKNGGIKFKEINITEHQEVIKDLENRGFQSLPVVAVGDLDNAFAGFAPDKLAKIETR